MQGSYIAIEIKTLELRIFTIIHPGVFSIIHPPPGFAFRFLAASLLHSNK
jgi:hypothetical protein